MHGDVDRGAELSFAQERMWVLEQFAPGRPTYNVPLVIRLRGPLDEGALQASLEGILTRHEVLRTTIRSPAGRPLQFVQPPSPSFLQTVDLSAFPTDEAVARARELATDESRRPIDLERGPILRASLFRLAEDDRMLCMVVHHIAWDGWSTSVFFSELSELYAAAVEARSPVLPDLGAQYSELAARHRREMTGAALTRHLEYWTTELGRDLPVFEVPTDRPRPQVQGYKGAVVRRRTSARLAEELHAVARRERASLFMVVKAALHALLYRYTGQGVVVTGAPVANRATSESQRLIGLFMNTMVFKSACSGEIAFSDLLRQIRTKALKGYAHQELPFEKLVEALAVERDTSRTPLFQIGLTFQSATDASLLTLPGVETELVHVDNGTSRLDLALVVWEERDGIVLSADYATDLFDRGTMERFLDHLQRMLEGICRDPTTRLSNLPLLGESETRELLDLACGPEVEVPPKTLHELFVGVAAGAPEATAVTLGDRSLTYSELDSLSDRVAASLLAAGAGPERLVAICMTRSLEAIAGILGILKSGSAYVPLDPAYPPERIRFVLGDTRAPVVLTQRRTLPSLPATGAQIVTIEDCAPGAPAPGVAVDPRSLAYVIYTSGSTGTPKGVAVSHASAVAFVQGVTGPFDITREDRLLQLASMNFDVSVFEIFTALLNGARVCLVPEDSVHAPHRLAELMEGQGVTVADIPPAILPLLDADAFRSLRLLFVGLEPFSHELVDAWTKIGRRFVNGYGPTEATVACVMYDCAPNHGAPPPIGRAMANHVAYVLDEHLNLVPRGVPGELYVGGAGLARGYLHRPGLTAERFVPDAFGDSGGGRLYRTGDLVKLSATANLEFLGRADDQVKLHGVRIELGEVASVLERHPKVRRAIAVVRPDADGNRKLVAYTVAEGDRPTEAELRAFVRAKVPAAMVPAHFVGVESFAVMPNGKIDRSALPAPEATRPEIGDGYVAPRTETEKTLARNVFAPVLGIDGVGVHENFFELGGNSLQAIQLISKVKETFDVDVSLRALFKAPTVASLAEEIDEQAQAGVLAPSAEGAEARAGVLVRVAEGVGPPLCLVHPSSGSILCYAELVPLLDGSAPVFAVEAAGLDRGETPFETIPAMAARYVSELRREHPQGPYRLGGWSLGGLVAFEMARQLRAAGEAITLLLLLDSEPPRHGGDSDVYLTGLFARDVAAMAGIEAPLAPEDLDSLEPHERLARVAAALRDAGAIPPELTQDDLGRRLDLFLTNMHAAAEYRPDALDGSLVLVRAASSLTTAASWERFVTGAVHEHVVPGDHYSMLREPSLTEVARLVARYLQESSSGSHAVAGAAGDPR